MWSFSVVFLFVLLLCNCQSLDLFKCFFIFDFIKSHFPETCILGPSLPMPHYTQLKWINCHFEHFLETFFSQKHTFVSFAICLATAKYVIFPASSSSFSTFQPSQTVPSLFRLLVRQCQTLGFCYGSTSVLVPISVSSVYCVTIHSKTVAHMAAVTCWLNLGWMTIMPSLKCLKVRVVLKDTLVPYVVSIIIPWLSK